MPLSSSMRRCVPAVLASVLTLGWLGAGAAAAATDDDWPCVQALVPEVSGGMIWTGPPLDEAASRWEEDPAVRDLAVDLAARRTPLEEARQQVEAFAEGLEPEVRNERLTMLFAGILETINSDRKAIIRGIKRFAREQQELSDRIVEIGAQLRELGDDGSSEDATRRRELEEQRAWGLRVHDERENSLTYLCEQPVLLEQRAFALARAIASHLDETSATRD